MTTAAMQAAVARLVTDRAFRQRIAEGDEAGEADDLAPEELRHVQALARDPGVVLTAKLIASFRLGKLLMLLPATRAALGDERFAEEALAFWGDHPPTSFYAADEVLAFCSHVANRVDRAVLPVVATEAAAIAQERDSLLVGLPGSEPGTS